MREFLDGATAVARGALDSGCTFFAGYPISPATPVLLHMIRELPAAGGVAIQAEDEIAAISMCIGAAMTGARAFTATSGPGLSLYSENIGLAIMGEVPLVIVDVQRMGPATGGATTTAQGDVQFARWGTSGGYPVIALAPASVAECYSLTRRAFDLAERFRTPVFLLTDKEMFLGMATVPADAWDAPPVRARAAATALPAGTAGLRPEETFLPYRFDPIEAPPPMSPIGGEHIVRFTGSTHDEHGLLTRQPEAVARLNEHLRRKIEDFADDLALVDADLEARARTLLVSYGSTARAMRAGAGAARRAGHAVSTLTIQSLWPVPERAIVAAAFGDHVERVVVAELNGGDYLREVERTIALHAVRTDRPAPDVVGLNRCDGELITPSQVLDAIEEGAAR